MGKKVAVHLYNIYIFNASRELASHVKNLEPKAQ